MQKIGIFVLLLLSSVFLVSLIIASFGQSKPERVVPIRDLLDMQSRMVAMMAHVEMFGRELNVTTTEIEKIREGPGMEELVRIMREELKAVKESITDLKVKAEVTQAPQIDPLALHRRLVNPLLPNIPYTHDPIFFRFVPWSGIIESGIVRSFLGTKFYHSIFCSSTYSGQKIAHAIRNTACDYFTWYPNGSGVVELTYPVFSEEYYEYRDVLRSVLDSRPGRPYRIVEIGAGYGHWTLEAISALRSLGRSDFNATMVEASSGKMSVIEDHLRLNGLANDPRIEVENAAVTGREGTVKIDDDPDNYGATVTDGSTVVSHVLYRYLERGGVIDMLDVDIQGSEAEIFTLESLELMKEKVKYVHVGTHEGDDIEEKLTKYVFGDEAVWKVELFPKAEHWQCNLDDVRTFEYGPACFADGVVSVTNLLLKGM
jgi:FkbM family methyltransferase